MKKLFLSGLFGAILFASTGVHAYDLSGKLLHAGVPMSEVTEVEPSFWFRSEDTGQTYDDAIATYSSSTGTYSIENLSGNIGISVSFHVTGERETLPGNYRLWRVVDPSTPSNIDLEIPVLIHVLEPYDNAIIIDWIPPYPVHSSPLTFRWEEVGGATYYQIYIYKCAASGVCTRFQDINTQDTTYTTRLSNSPPDQYYDFDINAYMGSSLIGHSLTTFTGGYGSYRFQVETPLPSTIPAVPLLLLED